MINIELNNDNRKNFYSHLSISRQTPKQHVIIIYRIEEAQKNEDVEIQCGGLVHKSDSFCIKGLKLLCVIPFLPAMLLWRLFKCIYPPLKRIYQKFILKWMNYLYLTIKIFFVILCQQIRICCLKLLMLIEQCCGFITNNLNKLKELINNFCSNVGQCIYNCCACCCNGCCDCLSYFFETIAIIIITIGKCVQIILRNFTDFSFRIILKSAQLRTSLQQAYSVISVSISLIIIAPIALFLINYIFTPITQKIILTTQITLLIIKLHILMQFYQLYIINTLKLLNFLIVRLFYKNLLLNFLYKGILLNVYKLFTLIFYNIAYKYILINIAKLVKWFALQLWKLMQAGYQGAKIVLDILCRLFKKCWNGILWVLKCVFRGFKCIIIQFYKYLIKPIFQFLWYICRSIRKIFKTIWCYSSKYFWTPIWKSITGLSTILLTFFSNIWKSLQKCSNYQEKQQNNQ